jgi:hypothetical protein
MNDVIEEQLIYVDIILECISLYMAKNQVFLFHKLEIVIKQ